MIYQCSICKKILRRTEDGSDLISHTYCPPCADELKKSIDEEIRADEDSRQEHNF